MPNLFSRLTRLGGLAAALLGAVSSYSQPSTVHYFGVNGGTPVKPGGLGDWNIKLPNYKSNGTYAPQVGVFIQNVSTPGLGQANGEGFTLSYNGLQLMPFYDMNPNSVTFVGRYGLTLEDGQYNHTPMSFHTKREAASNTKFHMLRSFAPVTSNKNLDLMLTKFKPKVRYLPSVPNPPSANPALISGATEGYIDLPLWLTVKHALTDTEEDNLTFKAKLTRFKLPTNATVNGEFKVDNKISDEPVLLSRSGPAYIYVYWENTTNSTLATNSTDGKNYDVLVIAAKDPEQNYLFGLASRDIYPNNNENGYREWDLIYSPKPSLIGGSNMLSSAYFKENLLKAQKDLKQTGATSLNGQYYNSFPFSLRFATVYRADNSTRTVNDIVTERVGQMVTDLGCAFVNASMSNTQLTPALSQKLPVAYHDLAGASSHHASNPNQWDFVDFAQNFLTQSTDNSSTLLALYDTDVTSGGITRKKLTTTTAVRNAFWDALNAEATRIINLYAGSVNAPKPSVVFIWDFEGMNGRGVPNELAEFVGDLQALPYFAPEMLIKKNGLGLTAIDNFLGRLRDNGIEIGVTLRPEAQLPYNATWAGQEIIPHTNEIGYVPLSLDKDNLGDQINLATVRQAFLDNMKEKIRYARGTYGVKHFYVDKNIFQNANKPGLLYNGDQTSYRIFGEFYRTLVSELGQESPAITDVTLYPELEPGVYKDKYYFSATAPYTEINSTSLDVQFNDVFTSTYPNGRYLLRNKYELGNSSTAFSFAESVRQQVRLGNVEYMYQYNNSGMATSINPVPSIYSTPTTLTRADHCAVTSSSTTVMMPGEVKVMKVLYPSELTDEHQQTLVPVLPCLQSSPGTFMVDVTQVDSAWGSFMYEWSYSATSSGTYTKFAVGPVLEITQNGFYKLSTWDMKNKTATLITSEAFPVGVTPVATCPAASSFAWKWVRTQVSDTYDRAYAVASDAQSNIYAVSSIGNDAAFTTGGSTSHTFAPACTASACTTDVALTKYDGLGNLMWQTSIRGTDVDNGFSIARTPKGDLVVVGSVRNSAKVNSAGTNPSPVTLATAGSSDENIFVAKYNSSTGILDWAFDFGSPYDDSENKSSVAVDGDGNIYVAGAYRNESNFEGRSSTALTANVSTAGSQDGFLAKFDKNGQLKWVNFLRSSTADEFTEVAVDASGAVYAVGHYSSNAALGIATATAAYSAHTGGSLTANATEAVLVKYNTNGSLAYTRTIGGSGTDKFRTLAFDRSGNVIAAGSFGSSSISAGGTTLTNQGSGGSLDAFAIAYNASGTVLWLRSYGGTGADEAQGAAVDPFGNVFVSGYFSDAAAASDNGSLTQTATASKDVFGWILSEAGTSAKVFKAGSYGDDQGFGICAMPNGGIAATGQYANNAVFTGVGTIAEYTGPGGSPWGAFVARYGPASAMRIGAEEAEPSGKNPSASLRLFPNPSTGKVTIRVTDGQLNAAIHIYSALGKKVLSTKLAKDGTASLDLSDLPSGIYRVSCQGKTASVVKQ